MTISKAKFYSLAIKTCIDTYATLVNERGDPHFADIYPILLDLGPRLVQSWKENSEGKV